MNTDTCNHGVEWKLVCAECGDAAVPWRHRLFVASIDLKNEQERVQRRNDDLGTLYTAVAELTSERKQMREALEKCANLTRHQETSPATVREVGVLVGAIVNAALAAPAPSGMRDYREMVSSMIIGVHPLPWTIEQDWALEVHDSQGAIVGKFRTKIEADNLIAFAGEIEAELAIRAAELEVELAAKPTPEVRDDVDRFGVSERDEQIVDALVKSKAKATPKAHDVRGDAVRLRHELLLFKGDSREVDEVLAATVYLSDGGKGNT